jgi:hypothetical protein
MVSDGWIARIGFAKHNDAPFEVLQTEVAVIDLIELRSQSNSSQDLGPSAPQRPRLIF